MACLGMSSLSFWLGAPKKFFLPQGYFFWIGKNELDGLLYWYAWARPNTAQKNSSAPSFDFEKRSGKLPYPLEKRTEKIDYIFFWWGASTLG